MLDHQGLILFDLTQLVLRSGFSTPTGIQRVEVAYARYLLENHRARTRFVIALPPKVQMIPPAVVARYIAATEKAWAYTEDGVRPRAAARINRFLAADVCNGKGKGKVSSWRTDNRLLLGADVMLWAVLQSMTPRSLGALAKNDQPPKYVCVSSSGIPSPWVKRWLLQNPQVSGIFLLHDLIPLTHPEYTRPGISERHRKYAAGLTQCASTVLANSQFTADSLANFAHESRLSLPPTLVAPLGVGQGFARREKSATAPPPYFVFVGTIEPRKNHGLLLQVWQRLVARHGAAAPKLVIIGRRGWENENVLDLLDRATNLRNHVIECSQLCDDLLADVVANARALLLPSHVEGYGLPVAEALSLGTPVICSDLPPLREIAGDIPEYVDPLAGRGWARMVQEYSDVESPARLAQLARLQNFRPPAWSDHFLKLESALSEVRQHQKHEIPMPPPLHLPGDELELATQTRLH